MKPNSLYRCRDSVPNPFLKNDNNFVVCRTDGSIECYSHNKKSVSSLLWRISPARKARKGGHFYPNIRMQADNNLVVYDSHGSAVWDSQTDGGEKGTLSLHLSAAGRLELRDAMFADVGGRFEVAWTWQFSLSELEWREEYPSAWREYDSDYIRALKEQPRTESYRFRGESIEASDYIPFVMTDSHFAVLHKSGDLALYERTPAKSRRPPKLVWVIPYQCKRTKPKDIALYRQAEDAKVKIVNYYGGKYPYHRDREVCWETEPITGDASWSILSTGELVLKSPDGKVFWRYSKD